ncbi:response regulator transcription factor [Nesterenkonia aerolata]|uniref:Response regulator transcription factor n=1 Tax=Nesterenkonia aerolata TaxID=3074079 RepID=A0ABU2DPS9_9MICC|nr:response regulator transcription factor [Nesterenkonia sp. LY-0111]MDR8018401.1 response regulator transcription factor [Nesterenkonia sp. LY-0111]
MGNHADPRSFTRLDGSPVRAVVVDDERNLTELLAMALGNEGWRVETAANGQEALNTIREFSPDVVVLDVMMPGTDGLEVLRRLRAAGNDVPVLFLTAKDSVDDRIDAITAGGDDYVTKPFHLREVVARVRGMARRYIGATSDDGPLVVGDLTLDERTYEVQRAGVPVRLTAKEFELLRYLMQNQRQVLTRAQILENVWSYDFGGKSGVVEIYISYLRKKIDSLGPALIHTVRSVGYTIRQAEA